MSQPDKTTVDTEELRRLHSLLKSIEIGMFEQNDMSIENMRAIVRLATGAAAHMLGAIDFSPVSDEEIGKYPGAVPMIFCTEETYVRLIEEHKEALEGNFGQFGEAVPGKLFYLTNDD